MENYQQKRRKSWGKHRNIVMGHIIDYRSTMNSNSIITGAGWGWSAILLQIDDEGLLSGDLTFGCRRSQIKGFIK